MFRHLQAVDWSLGGGICMFFLVIWRLINNPIDIKWIMMKEFIDGSLDYTCTLICGNPGKRALRSPIWPQSGSDVFV
jgi:hypothetical protein